MKKHFFTPVFCLILFVPWLVKGQSCLPTDEPPGPLVCWPSISNFSASTAGYTPDGSFPGFCGTIENNSWFSFIACEPTATFSIVPFNCRYNLGIQAAIFDQNMQMVSDCFSSDGMANGGEINALNLIPGEIYHFMVDGYSGDQCNYNLTVKVGISPSFFEFNFSNTPGFISGPGSVCPGEVVNLTLIPPICEIQALGGNGCPLPNTSGFFDTIFHWSLPDGGQLTTGSHDGINQVTWRATASGTISVRVELVPKFTVCNFENCFPWLSGNGCNLEVLPFHIILRSPELIQLPDAQICEGNCAYFRGQEYCKAGNYSILVHAEDGCDTTFLITVSEIKKGVSNLGRQQLCAGECFDFNGISYCESGWYEVVFTGSNGCDSIVNFELDIFEKQETQLPKVKICKGDCFQIANATFCEPGAHKLTLIDKNGCDSLVHFQLEILQPSRTELPLQTICEGDCVEKDGRALCQSGRYAFTYSAANGCDSVVWLDLDVQKPKVTQLPPRLLCPGTCFEIDGRQFCAEGKFKIDKKDRFGCDSSIVFELFYRNLSVQTTPKEILSPERSNVQLFATLNGRPENVVFSWQKEFSSAVLSNTAVLTTDSPGKYIFTARDTLRGCMTKDTSEVLQWKQTCREDNPVSPGLSCAEAPFLCGELLNGYCTTLRENPALQPDALVASIGKPLQNPHWLKWSPCEAEVVFEFASANCGQAKGLEIYVLKTDDCVHFEMMAKERVLKNSDLQQLNVKNLVPGEVYYLLADGIDGDFCQLKIAIKKGINIKPLELVQVSGGYIDAVKTACTGDVITLSLVPPVCAIQSADGCAFPLGYLDYVVSDVQWTLPPEAQLLTDPNSSWIQIQFPPNSLLPENFIHEEGKLTWLREIKAEVPGNIRMPNGMFCNIQGVCGTIQNLELEITHEIVQLPPVKICEGECFEFCGKKYCTPSKAICREENCRTIIQEIQIEKPSRLDYGKVEICRGSCFTLPLSGTVLCEPGEYKIPVPDDCGSEEIVKLQFYDLQPVLVGPITEICDALHTSYNISFDILEGTSPFKVNGILLRDNHFVSQRIPNNTPFHFEIIDASVCKLKQEVFGSYDCGPLCASEAGTMADQTLQVCENQTAYGVHLSNHILDSDDAFDFVLHTNSGKSLGSVLAQNTEGAFRFLPGLMEYEKPYYISFVVGNKLNGKVDLNDFCLSVAAGQPVVFKQNPISEIVENQTLTCDLPEVELWANLNESTTNCQWIDPDLNVFNQPILTATKAGAYRCVATGANGCSFEKTVFVSENKIYPSADAGDQKEINCDQVKIYLDGSQSSQGPEYAYEWTTSEGKIDAGENTLQPLVSAEGTYLLKVKNQQNGCISIDKVEVVQNESVPKNVKFHLQMPTCFGDKNGSIEIKEINGGTPPYQFSFDDAVFSSNRLFNRLQSGTYKIEIKDAHNCRLSKEVTLNEPPGVEVELGDDIFVKLGEAVTLTAASTVAPTKIKWWNDLGDTQIGSLDWTLIPTATSRHFVRIEDNFGCFDMDEIQVYVQGSSIYIPSGFSPNGDLQNDRFLVYAANNVKEVRTIRVFDRRGQIIFERLKIKPGVEADGWDGTFRDKPLPPDVFAYVVEIEFLNGDVEVFKGDVTLIR